MRWLRLWCLLAIAFVAGHVMTGELVPGTSLWTARFWARLGLVPVAETLVVGLLLSRAGARRRRFERLD